MQEKKKKRRKKKKPVCPGALNGPHSRHFSSPVPEAMPRRLGSPQRAPGTPGAVIHGIQCGLIRTCRPGKGSSSFERAFRRTDSTQGVERAAVPLRGRVQTRRPTPRPQLLLWSARLSSFSATNQTVNGVCPFPTAGECFLFPLQLRFRSYHWSPSL